MAAPQRSHVTTILLTLSLLGLTGCPIIDPASQDADAEGASDNAVMCLGFDDTRDTDNDGVPDACDRCAGFDDTRDDDADGVPNGCDVDNVAQRNDLAEIAVVDEDVDLRNLVVGDEVVLAVPDNATTLTAPQPIESNCTCGWSVQPPTAGTFDPPDACTTIYTVSEAGDALIVVIQTCDEVATELYNGTTAAQSDSELGDIPTVMAAGVTAVAAALPQLVIEGGLVALDGTQSVGPGPLMYEWRQLDGGPTVTIQNDHQAIATFIAPGVVVATPVAFELNVTVAGLMDTDTVEVIIFDASSPPPPPPPAPPPPPPPPCIPSECDDGDYCNGQEVCLGNTCLPGVPPCPGPCDEVADLCTCPGGTNAECDDGLFCNGAESCGAGNVCQSGSSTCAAAGQACDEEIDACFTCADAADCDDGLFCNGQESCDANNLCQSGPPPDCDDGVACTDDACNEFIKACQHVPVNANCDDGVFCNGSETCTTTNGCTSGNPVSCDDGVDCTVDSCNEAAAACDHVPDDALCDDAFFCTGQETCSAANGCSVGADPCPGQFCDETTAQCLDALSISGSFFRGDGATSATQRPITVEAWSSPDNCATLTNLEVSVVSTDGTFSLLVPTGFTGCVIPNADDVLFENDAISYSNVQTPFSNQDFDALFFFYVSGAGGSDTNTGTENSPFATIQHAADSVTAGDTVLVMGGTYGEWVRITANGTAQRPILFRNYRDDVVVVDGEGARVGCITIGSPGDFDFGRFVTVDGFQLTGTRNGTGTGGEGGACAIMWHTRNATFRNVTATHCGFGSPIVSGAIASGIAVRGQNTDCTVAYCEVSDAYRTGIQVLGAGGNTPGVPANITIDNCYVHNNENGDDEDSDGIAFSATGAPDHFTNSRITHSIVHDNADDGLDASSTNAVLFAHNIVFDHGRNTIDGDGNGIKVSTGTGGATGGGNHTVRHNIVFRNARGGIDQDISSDAPHNMFYHNTVWGNDDHGLILDVGGGTNLDTAAVAVNNILANNSQSGDAFLDYRAGSGGCTMSQPDVILDSDFNVVEDGCLHANEGAGTVTCSPTPCAPLFADPDAAINTTDQGSIYNTLQFIRDQAYSHFAPAEGSAAIDSARDVNLGLGAFDTGGAANTGSGPTTFFDRGAVEAGMPTISFATTNSTVGEGAGTHTVNVTIAFAGGTPANQSVTVDVIEGTGGSAMAPFDFGAIGTQTLTFPAGSPSGTTRAFTLGVIDDARVEPAETVVLVLRNVAGPARLLTPIVHTVTINDND